MRKVLRSEATEFRYEREEQPLPRLGRGGKSSSSSVGERGEAEPRATDADPDFRGPARAWLRGRLRRGPSLRPGWQQERASSVGGAYVPLSFAPGEAYQFDWSHEIVLINGATTTVKVAHVRLCHSRMLFVRAYPRETQEMVFDAHDRAFAFFKGTCTRGIYDNMKTAVETIFVGSDAPTIAASCRCAATIWLIRLPARRRPAGRRAKSRTRSGWCASGSSHRDCGPRATRS